MSDASTLHPLAGLAPPPEKMPSLLKQLKARATPSRRCRG